MFSNVELKRNGSGCKFPRPSKEKPDALSFRVELAGTWDERKELGGTLGIRSDTDAVLFPLDLRCIMTPTGAAQADDDVVEAEIVDEPGEDRR